MLHGVNTSLLVGASVAAIALCIGLVLGTTAGFYRGSIDHVIMRAADGLLIVPTFFLVLAVAFIFGGRLTFVIVMLGLTTWPQIARIVRAEVLALKEEAFVQSARALGAGDLHLMFREILPNTLPPVVAMIALLGSSAILAEASLSFLGVGDPNVVSLGQMLTSGLEYVTNAWWVPGFPGAAIFVLVLLLNVLGDGLTDHVRNATARRQLSGHRGRDDRAGGYYATPSIRAPIAARPPSAPSPAARAASRPAASGRSGARSLSRAAPPGI